MGEVFIVQKRPCGQLADGFYFRIVDTRTGEPLMANFLNESHADEQCCRLNDRAARTQPNVHTIIPFQR